LGAGGTGASGGRVGGGGELGTGGRLGSGGTTLTGGKPGSGGGFGTGGEPRSGGAPSTGGTIVGYGGTSGTGGATGVGGGFGTGGAALDGGFGSGGSSGTVTFPPKFVGNIDTSGSVRADFVSYWDQFSPENAGKWGAVQASSASTFNWNALDAMYKYCEDNNILFKEHTFLWGASLPVWMGALTTSTGPAAVQNWMKAFCERYPKTRVIDVVNEPPPHATHVYANAIGGGTNTTWDWIANAFKWAHEACPNAILVMNDYNNIEFATDVQHTIDIVTAIKKLDAPIHAIGCQTHNALDIPSSTLSANIEKIVSATGLPVYITEYDIGLADDELQRQQYQDHLTMFWQNPSVKGVTIWGYVVGSTWRTNTGIMRSDGSKRPAMTWLMDFLGR
jgi:endo-1,4-beta-xylanase